MSPIITSHNIHLYYGKKEILKGIDLDFYEHEITALIGPSGSGKSSYLRSINRMNDLINDVHLVGDISFHGRNIYQPGIDLVNLRKQIGMVFQQPNPFPFSIYDNIAYGLRIAGIKDKRVLNERVETSLKQAAIWNEVKDNLTDHALALSGGQQQRICIARVLALQPEIILLDEPTSALDPVSGDQVEQALVDLKNKFTSIMVTHNMQQASRISDRTAFFLSGQLVEVGKTQQIFVAPKNQETSDYLSGKFG